MLVSRGNQVMALARSEGAAEKVESRGAVSVFGDLDSLETLDLRMRGCQYVFHCAAHVSDWGPWSLFHQVNVRGTQNVVQAAQHAGVTRLIHVSSEAVLASHKPLVQATEDDPYPVRSLSHYGQTKRLAEELVRDANAGSLETIIMRPRAVWGPADTILLPWIRAQVLTGRFRWIDQGRPLTSTCFVDNAVEGLLLAASHGEPGETYFLSDGDSISVKEFFTGLLETQRLQPVAPNIPFRVAVGTARLTEVIWKLLRLQKRPPLTLASVLLFGQEMTVDDQKARTELGYRAEVERARGLVQMVTAGPAPRYEEKKS